VTQAAAMLQAGMLAGLVLTGSVQIWHLFALAILLLTFYGFTLVANFIAAPFNGLLAERVEEMLTGQPPTSPGGGVLQDLLPSLWSEVRKLLYFLLRAIPLLLLFLIPGVNLVAPLLWFLFNAWYLALQLLPESTAQRRLYRVAATAIGRGIGRQLLGTLVTECERRGYRQMLAVIGDSANAASIQLHRACGFAVSGTLQSVGFKFGRWVDSVLMQRGLGASDRSPPAG